MILSNILLRTFFIKAASYGTAFTIDVGNEEYLVTAKHLLDLAASEFELQIFHDREWLKGHASVVAHGKGEIDISVLKLPQRITAPDLVVTLSHGGMLLGQDVFFLGFPFKMWSDAGTLFQGRALPYVKKGTVSSMSNERPQILYVDAINNEGFSGGPLFFYPVDRPGEVRIAGVVSKFRTEYETVLDADGNQTSMTVAYNTGFLLAYTINHVLELIPGAKAW